MHNEDILNCLNDYLKVSFDDNTFCVLIVTAFFVIQEWYIHTHICYRN